MNQLKKTQVVLLPTENSSTILLRNSDSKLILYKKLQHNNEFVHLKTQQLLIISDDEIKSDDHWFNLDRNDINSGEFWNIANMAPSCKKIIASYPPLIIGNKVYVDEIREDSAREQSQPTQQFIEQYIESYNKGEIITDVLVEYIKTPNAFLRKINPDNTITIKQVKDNWNREEVLALLIKNEFDNHQQAESYTKSPQFLNWIKQNL